MIDPDAEVRGALTVLFPAFHDTGSAYGVMIKELKLLARTVFIIDAQDVVRYVERVPEITQQPDYDRVLNAARALL